MVELLVANEKVAGSNLVSRSRFASRWKLGGCARLLCFYPSCADFTLQHVGDPGLESAVLGQRNERGCHEDSDREKQNERRNEARDAARSAQAEIRHGWDYVRTLRSGIGRTEEVTSGALPDSSIGRAADSGSAGSRFEP